MTIIDTTRVMADPFRLTSSRRTQDSRRQIGFPQRDVGGYLGELEPKGNVPFDQDRTFGCKAYVPSYAWEIGQFFVGLQADRYARSQSGNIRPVMSLRYRGGPCSA